MKQINDTVILITRDGMGDADHALQIKLIQTYLKLLLENESFPGIICFYGDGVKLTVEESTVLESLRKLEENGVRLVICSTCLNHYQLQDKVKVGVVGGMTDILEAQIRAEKVISI